MESPLSLCLSKRDFGESQLEDVIIAFGAANIEKQGDSFLHLLAHYRRVDLVAFCLSHYAFDSDRRDSDSCTFL